MWRRLGGSRREDVRLSELTGISTANLEGLIETLLTEIEPPSEGFCPASFGVNAVQWGRLRDAVLEYIRICRNSRTSWINPLSKSEPKPAGKKNRGLAGKIPVTLNGETYPSIRAAARALSVSKSTINRMLRDARAGRG